MACSQHTRWSLHAVIVLATFFGTKILWLARSNTVVLFPRVLSATHPRAGLDKIRATQSEREVRDALAPTTQVESYVLDVALTINIRTGVRPGNQNRKSNMKKVEKA